MARLTKAQREWRPGMPKKRRSTKVMFASVVLSLEAFVAVFFALAVFGLQGHKPSILVGGGILAVVLILSCAFMGKKWGPAVGWLLQLVLIAAGFIQPAMFVIGVLFALAWWYGLRTGGRIDVENAQRDRAQATWDAEHPDLPGGAGSVESGSVESGVAESGVAESGTKHDGGGAASRPAAQ